MKFENAFEVGAPVDAVWDTVLDVEKVAPTVPGAQRAIATGEPQLVEELGDDLLRAIAADDPDLAELRPMRARSVLTLPLAMRGARFGAVTLLVGSSGRRYTGADLDFARLVQGRMSIVLDNTGLSRAAQRSERLMVAALDALEEAVTMNGPDGRTVYVNRAAVRLLKARSAEELLHSEPGEITSRFEVYDEAGEPVSFRQLPAFRALAGEEQPEPLLVRNVVRATGEERWLLNKVSVLRDGEGAVDRIVNVIEDLTEVKRAEVRQRLLAEATRVLSASEEGQPEFARVAGVLVPELADWCAIEVLMPTGRIDAVSLAHADPARASVVRELRAEYPIHASDRGALAREIAGGSARVHSLDEHALREYARD